MAQVAERRQTKIDLEYVRGIVTRPKKTSYKWGSVKQGREKFRETS